MLRLVTSALRVKRNRNFFLCKAHISWYQAVIPTKRRGFHPSGDIHWPLEISVSRASISTCFAALRVDTCRPFAQGVQWCPGLQTEADNPESDYSDGQDSVSDTSSDGCCFKLSVFDAHNPDVRDTSGKFCLEPTAMVVESSPTAEGENVDLGSAGKLGAKLEVVKFPPSQWEIGTAQEVCSLRRHKHIAGSRRYQTVHSSLSEIQSFPDEHVVFFVAARYMQVAAEKQGGHDGSHAMARSYGVGPQASRATRIFDAREVVLVSRLVSRSQTLFFPPRPRSML